MKNKTKVEIIQPFIDGQEKGDINYMNPDDAKRYHEYGAVKIIEETKKPTQKKETKQKEKGFKFIIDKFYSEKLGDYDKITQQFEIFKENFTVKNKILLELSNEIKCAEDIDYLKLTTVRKNMTRLAEEDLIVLDSKKDKTKYYTCNERGIQELIKAINKDFISKNSYILNNLRINRKEKTKKLEIQNLVKEVMEFFQEKVNVEDFLIDGFFTFDLLEILEINVELGEYIIENFEDGKEMFKIALKDIVPEISKIREHTENIKFTNLDKIKTQCYNICEIPKKTSEFVNTRGLLVKKNTKIKEEVLMNYYLCLNPNCPHSEDKLKSDKVLKECPQCKSKINLIDRKIKSVQHLELKDSENDMSIKIKAYDNLTHELVNVKIGEELNISGNIKYIKCDENKNDNETFERVFILNNYKSTANSIHLSKEDETEVIEQLKSLNKDKKTPYEFLIEPIKKMYPLHPEELLKFLLMPQILNYKKGVEDIFHVLSIGSPNTYKTSLLKAIGEISPKVKNIDLSMLSVDKFYGGVKADGLTDVGLAMSLRDGSLIVDEIDKDTDSFEKTAKMLNEVMTEQTATKERVGASIFLKDVNIRIYGVMNDKEGVDDLKWIMKNMNESTVTRFFIINFDYFINEEIRNNITRSMITSTNRVMDDYDTEIRKKIIVYLRKLNVDLSEIYEDLFEFIKIIRAMVNQKEHLTRNIQQIKNIIIANCRLNGRNKATKEDLQEAIKLIGWTFKTQDIQLDNYEKKWRETLEEVEIDRINCEN